jgi:hypothetical protein
MRSSIDECIHAYEQYQSFVSNGFMNASAEVGISAGINVVNSQISGGFLDREYLARSKLLAAKNANIISNDERITADVIAKNPELEEFLDLIEKASHECFHGMQKHAYRSVVTFVNALQEIEGWELKLFFSHLQKGGVWRSNQSFIECIRSIDSEQVKAGVADKIKNACIVAMEGFRSRADEISLAHLIEGQAYVAGRLAAGVFDVLPSVADELYTKAWGLFVENGGSSPMLFIAICDAAMRYGDIDDEPGDNDFSDFYPHPVDIFLYMLNFVGVLEHEIEHAELHLVRREESIPMLFGGKQADRGEQYPSTQTIDRKLKDAVHRAKDSSIQEHSYLAVRMSIFDFDSSEEMSGYKKKNFDRIFSAFGDGRVAANDHAEAKMILSYRGLCMLIAGIVGRTYSRVANPVEADEKAGTKSKRVADAVFDFYHSSFASSEKVEFFAAALLDKNFIQEQLFPFFLYEIDENVRLNPFDFMPSMTHNDYRSMMLMPDAVKGMLNVLHERFGHFFVSAKRGPYCCAEHGFVSLSDCAPAFYDKCENEDSVSRALEIGFGRKLGEIVV